MQVFQKWNWIFRTLSIWEKDLPYETESKSYYRISTHNHHNWSQTHNRFNRYYRKFFPIFSNEILPLNELTRKNVPFKWTEQCQKSSDYIKHIITTSPILAPDTDKQYIPFMDSSKHSWCGVLIQYSEHEQEKV